MATCKYQTLLMRYYISELKGQKMGGVIQPAALQSVLRKCCVSGSLLCGSGWWERA